MNEAKQAEADIAYLTDCAFAQRYDDDAAAANYGHAMGTVPLADLLPEWDRKLALLLATARIPRALAENIVSHWRQPECVLRRTKVYLSNEKRTIEEYELPSRLVYALGAQRQMQRHLELGNDQPPIEAVQAAERLGIVPEPGDSPTQLFGLCGLDLTTAAEWFRTEITRIFHERQRPQRIKAELGMSIVKELLGSLLAETIQHEEKPSLVTGIQVAANLIKKLGVREGSAQWRTLEYVRSCLLASPLKLPTKHDLKMNCDKGMNKEDFAKRCQKKLGLNGLPD